MFILGISGPWLPNGSQDASGRYFSAFLGSRNEMAFRIHLEAQVWHFCVLVAKGYQEADNAIALPNPIHPEIDI